jgi:hypothetical protein
MKKNQTVLFCVGRVRNFVCLLSLAFFAAANYANSAEYTSVDDFADNKEVKRDFDIQGEYLLEVDKEKPDVDDKGNPVKFGLNIIARGGGKFDVVGFVGGLPGDGGVRENVRAFANAEIKDDLLVVTLNEFELKKEDGNKQRKKYVENQIRKFKIEAGKLIQDGNASLVQDGNASLVQGGKVLSKVVRKSPTLNAKVPEGGITLFDNGIASKEFTKAKINEKAKTLWSEASTSPFEKRPYSLHIEFLTSYMPTDKGQGRSNSGVYIDECYECQILDSFGLEGLNNECGGFYQQAAPLINMCYPPLQWQTYDIDFTPAKFDESGKKIKNAKINLKHNGIVIHKDFEPKHETPGHKKETPEARGLYLQGHGNKVQFKNIWLKYND